MEEFILWISLTTLGLALFALNFTERGRRLRGWMRGASLNQPRAEVYDRVVGSIVGSILLYVGSKALARALGL